MKDRKILQDKINRASIKPSDRTWQKIESGLEKEDRVSTFKRRSVMGWAAAALILVMAYFTGWYESALPEYTPETLELNDQASEIQLQKDFYPINYRKDGRLIPNYQAIWKHPLVPRM